MSGSLSVVYRQPYGEFGIFTDQFDQDAGSRVALRAFADHAAAETHAAGLMRAARRTCNPFTVCDHGHADFLPKRLKGHRIKWRVSPKTTGWDGSDWMSWYDAEAPHLSDDERAKVWALFDARPLYGV